MKKHIKLSILVFSSILLFTSCFAQNSRKLNETFEMEKEETISIVDEDLQIQFLGAGTAHAINDDVIDDANFIVTHGGITEEIYLENINGVPGKIKIGDYIIILEYAYGYSQSCAITVKRE
ncbi:MAG: hypothetical protein QNK23_18520 [Crocinitomicaceae bacterium]|nr:hypothetical protein [Crocinitomicaceae bacterium]